jgi:hypothetical protein
MNPWPVRFAVQGSCPASPESGSQLPASIKRYGTGAVAATRRPPTVPWGVRQSRPYSEPDPGASHPLPLPVGALANPVAFRLSGVVTGAAARRAGSGPGE